MKSLKRYKVTLTTVGPVHIGSGEARPPKEYVRVPQVSPKLLWFPDMGTLYADLIERGKASAFEQFVQSGSSGGGRRGQEIQGAQRLDEWLRGQGMPTDPPQGTSLLKSWGGYGVRLGDFANSRDRYDPQTKRILAGRPQPLNEIRGFIKDGLGQPYVPGSSLKGLVRTLIAEWYIMKREERTGRHLVGMPADARAKDAASSLEEQLFRTISRPGTRPNDAVNDIFQVIRVSDSRLLQQSDLLVVQKIDVNTKDDPAGLPLFREVLRPGIEVIFDVAVNTSLGAKVDGVDVERLVSELCDIATKTYIARFSDYIDKFGDIPDMVYHDTGPLVYLGGGAGYRSKTVVNDQQVMSRILDAQFNRGNRPVPHIDKTAATGVSPLVLKLAKIDGKYYEMGKCRLSVEPLS